MKSKHSRKLVAAAIMVGAATGITLNTGVAYADDSVVTDQAQEQAGQPGMPSTSPGNSGGGNSAPDSTGQPGMPSTPPAQEAPRSQGGDAQPGMPSTPQQQAPSAPAQPQSPSTPERPSAPAQPQPQQGQPQEQAPAVPQAPTAPAPPAPTQPGMPVTPKAPAPKPQPKTFEQKLQAASPKFPTVQTPPTGADEHVAAQQVTLAGENVTVPEHVVPIVTNNVTPLIEHGKQVGTVNEGTIGTLAAGTVSTTVVDDTYVSAGVGTSGDNKVGVAQVGQQVGNYEGAAATSGSDAGYGNAHLVNNVNNAGNGSTAVTSVSWTGPEGDTSVQVSGKGTFGAMQIPDISGGVSVKTPWGDFKTPGTPK